MPDRTLADREQLQLAAAGVTHTLEVIHTPGHAANHLCLVLLEDGLLFSGGVKLFMDGSGGARTAWMYDDWNKDFTGTDTGNRG